MIAAQHHESETLVSLSNASKFYGSFAALKDVSLDLKRGEVHILLGENGAGKSTLVSLITGVNRLDEGSRQLHDQPTPHLSPVEARQAGINAVLQDFSLAPALTLEENYVLGREPMHACLLDRKTARAVTVAALEKLGLDLDPERRVDTLSRAEQQMLEIARALGGRPGVLILDEPTASLSHEESERLFEVIAQLKADNWAILYISHRMEEVRRLGDVVTILRDGQMTGHYRLDNVTNDQLIADMVGREMEDVYPHIAHQPGETVLQLAGLCSGSAVHDATITLCAGEIVGLGGLIGCGKSELARAIFGLREVTGGHIVLDGQNISRPDPAGMLARGLVYLPQDRRGEALALNRSIAENIALEVLADGENSKLGFVRFGKLAKLVDDLLARLNISPREPAKKVDELSGGNQQKVVLGRALSRARQVYIFDEPTSGIDVGARLDFYRQLQSLCTSGAAVLLVTSDLQELVHMSHRVLVMHEGHLVVELTGDQLCEETVVAYAFGETPDGDRLPEGEFIQ